MKFISENSVKTAWINLSNDQQNTKASLNRFFGLLATLETLNIKPGEKIKTSYSYELRNGNLSEVLQSLFYFGDNPKRFQSTELTYVTFSHQWVSNVFKYFLKNTPLSITDAAIIFYQGTPFDDDISTSRILEQFRMDLHFDVNETPFFESHETEIEFSDTRINRAALFRQIVAQLGLDPEGTKKTLSLEHNLYEANAGELTRGPFSQPLYSGQEAQKCLLFTSFSLSSFYNIIPETPLSEQDSKADLKYRNLLLYGAPGTGKSYLIEERSKSFRNRKTRVTFYPEYSYAKFVGSYKPSTYYKHTGDTYSPSRTSQYEGYNVINEPVIDYTFVPGPFLQALVEAYKSSQPYLLIIEEINRANAAAVFGEVFQLLDRKNGESIYKVMLSDEAMQYLRNELGPQAQLIEEGIYIPQNLYLWATMNSADQGVFHMDAAFKRRWHFEYLPLNHGEAATVSYQITFSKRSYRWNDFRREINNFLSANKVAEDRLLGPFFMSKIELTDENAVKNKLLVYLRDDVLRHNPRVLFKHGTFSEVIEHYASGDIFIDSLQEKLASIVIPLHASSDETD